jgi:hypothetical protein
VTFRQNCHWKKPASTEEDENEETVNVKSLWSRMQNQRLVCEAAIRRIISKAITDESGLAMKHALCVVPWISVRISVRIAGLVQA